MKAKPFISRGSCCNSGRIGSVIKLEGIGGSFEYL